MTAATIFALSTPPGRSAIAVVRLSGPAVPRLLAALAPPAIKPRQAALRRIVDPSNGTVLDEALVLYFAAPRSETGEDMAEFQLHGGKAVVRAVLDVLARQEGCRPAEPGEFAGRGFANGKLDLAQIEGLADLIDAETEAQRRQALVQASGLQSHVYDSWRASALQAMGLFEAAIDFADEADVAADAIARAKQTVENLAAELARALADGHRGEILRDGFRVVLAGPPNAGKSSLLNALARRDVAIVSEEAGTTRDVIDVRLDLEGHAVVVSDTAGIRQTSSVVEREGIRRTLAATESADLVLWLFEAGSSPPDLPGGDTDLAVATKLDLLMPEARIHVKHPAVSAKTGEGLDALLAMIAERARTAGGDASAPAVTRLRHRHQIEDAAGHLARCLADAGKPLELSAEDVRLAANALGRLTGRIDPEEVLGEIFSRFCIGK